ncbi:hypothetical protein ACRALDRAFT_1063629 [Sodiomyces alcalophilus JCM 7366]|uniref:uncharacterized protein n=1 Tax=Sodiomyces alcalophilus JCM 7366 TaxID=591952 RepID=UPI0039B4D075
MPGLTIATDSASGGASGGHSSARQPQPPARSASPTRPPVSPITPTSQPAQLSTARFRPNSPQPRPPAPSQSQSHEPPSFAAGRQTYTQARLVPDASLSAIPPPPTIPIDFDANPDVLALQSAISILQMQRQRATNDIRTLSAAKDAAIADPPAFLADLTSGRLRNQSEPLFAAAAPGSAPRGDPDSSSASSDEDDQMDVDGQQSTSTATRQSAKKERERKEKKQQQQQQRSKNKNTARQPAEPSARPAPPPPWTELPRPQNVVRCPPINWSQYAVVGESLDKLHAEQLRRPDQGQPAVMGPGGTYDFRASGEANPTEFVGVAAPYAPGRDKIEKKPRGDPKR